MQKPNCSSCPAGIDIFPLKKCEANGGGGGTGPTGPAGPQGKRGKAGAGIIPNYIAAVKGGGTLLTSGDPPIPITFNFETSNKGWATLVSPQSKFVVPQDGTYKINFSTTGQFDYTGPFTGTTTIDIIQRTLIDGNPPIPIFNSQVFDVSLAFGLGMILTTPISNPELMTNLTAGDEIEFTYEITSFGPTINQLAIQNAFVSIQRID